MSNTVSKALQIGLVRCDLKQADIARHLDIHRSYVSEICNGKKELKPSRLETLAVELFEVKLSVLISWGEV